MQASDFYLTKCTEKHDTCLNTSNVIMSQEKFEYNFLEAYLSFLHTNLCLNKEIVALEASIVHIINSCNTIDEKCIDVIMDSFYFYQSRLSFYRDAIREKSFYNIMNLAIQKVTMTNQVLDSLIYFLFDAKKLQQFIY